MTDDAESDPGSVAVDSKMSNANTTRARRVKHVEENRTRAGREKGKDCKFGITAAQ